MVMAIFFPLQASSIVEAELKAIVFSIRWAVGEGFHDLLVEFDSKMALEYLSGRETRMWKDMEPVWRTLFSAYQAYQPAFSPKT
ncbi:unnamed protein product [Cuscuta epithymum]|uniref:RNase H type-1 domain-containing protein n=1 Tax=Cuscuta epithymum TaxID=186058 RepID=A0AAV0EZV2_9ASTE|nr:unnamed protein product [Cuscuta epithymum]